LNIGELFFVIIDDLFGFAAADAEVVCEAECALAVDDSEVDAFGLVAHFLCDVLFVYAEDFCGGSGMDIFSFAEGFAHIGVAADGCDDAQFDLRIIG
jgi:hypothetical protein